MFERFGRLAKDKMVILISHRFSTVRMADEIVVLERGQVTERGTHETLMQAGWAIRPPLHPAGGGLPLKSNPTE